MENNEEFFIKGEVKPGNNVQISSKKGGTYLVSVGRDQTYTCTCKSFEFNKHCKHVDFCAEKAPQPANGLQGVKPNESLFTVKGKPNIAVAIGKDKASDALKTMLMQKVEEIRERDKNKNMVRVAHPGAEFIPEAVPYIPDNDSPALDKHTLATPERNAGFQDASMVPKMYKKSIRPAVKSKVTLEVIPAVKPDKPADNSAVKNTAEPTVKSSEDLRTKLQAKKQEFEMKVSRSQMHKGGLHMPNESRPYRPGE